jgi:hypothetical protein
MPSQHDIEKSGNWLIGVDLLLPQIRVSEDIGQPCMVVLRRTVD